MCSKVVFAEGDDVDVGVLHVLAAQVVHVVDEVAAGGLVHLRGLERGRTAQEGFGGNCQRSTISAWNLR